MPDITVSLTEGQLLKLNELARRFKMPSEEIARIGIDDLLTRPDDEFQQAMEYVLKKNAELYRRLA
jgi:hypothetical protein